MAEISSARLSCCNMCKTNIVLTFVIALSCLYTEATAQQPKKLEVVGIALGDSPEKVISKLQDKYPGCDIEVNRYLPGLPESPIGTVKLSAEREPTLSECTENQKQHGRIDSIEIQFLHSSKSSDSPAFEITFERSFEGASSRPITVAEMTASLIEEFGPALLQPLRVDSTGTMVEEMMSRLKKRPISTFHYSQPLFWRKGKPKNEFNFCTAEECGPYTMTASVDGSGKKGAPPRSLSASKVSITMTDQVASTKQSDWRFERRETQRDNSKKF